MSTRNHPGSRARPCKSCGTDQHLVWKTFTDRTWWIACEKCGARGAGHDVAHDALASWNAGNP